MRLPHQIATLLYCFNLQDEVLLLERRRSPNQGLWSPCGGKLRAAEGESPYACACREAGEEINLRLKPSDLHLTGLVSEHGYEGENHWLMFLFEVRIRLEGTPPAHPEGRFAFFSREALRELPVPRTDRDQLWPLFWQHRGGFFATHCHVKDNGACLWNLEESIPLITD